MTKNSIKYKLFYMIVLLYFENIFSAARITTDIDNNSIQSGTKRANSGTDENERGKKAKINGVIKDVNENEFEKGNKFLDGVIDSDINTVKEYLEKGGNPNFNRVEEYNRLLAKYSDDFILCSDRFEYTDAAQFKYKNDALEFAANNCDEAMVKLLLKFGAEPNFNSGLLYTAINFHWFDIIELLISKESFKQKKEIHKFVLDKAISINDRYIIDLLIRNGLDESAYQNSLVKADRCSTYIDRALLSKGANINTGFDCHEGCTVIRKCTPLIRAILLNRIDKIRLYLELGADLLDIKSSIGSCLEIVVSRKNHAQDCLKETKRHRSDYLQKELMKFNKIIKILNYELLRRRSIEIKRIYELIGLPKVLYDIVAEYENFSYEDLLLS